MPVEMFRIDKRVFTTISERQAKNANSLARNEASGLHRIIICMNKPSGKIIIERDANVWPHELQTAEALMAYGYTVKFIRKSEEDYKRSADAYIDGKLFEMKSPTGSHLSVVGKNIKKAMSQSYRIVFDSKRMKNACDYQVLNELKKQLSLNRKIESLIYVDKKRTVEVLK